MNGRTEYPHFATPVTSSIASFGRPPSDDDVVSYERSPNTGVDAPQVAPNSADGSKIGSNLLCLAVVMAGSGRAPCRRTREIPISAHGCHGRVGRRSGIQVTTTLATVARWACSHMQWLERSEPRDVEGSRSHYSIETTAGSSAMVSISSAGREPSNIFDASARAPVPPPASLVLLVVRPVRARESATVHIPARPSRYPPGVVDLHAGRHRRSQTSWASKLCLGRRSGRWALRRWPPPWSAT